MDSGSTVVLGAGPAGLTAGYLLARESQRVSVIEAAEDVGGLARTEVRDGFRFDLGGHRFFTKSREVERLWQEMLGDELLLRKRLSRIYYRGRFLDYPLSAGDVIRKLGPLELSLALGSYIAAAVRRNAPEETFEQWVSNRFGRRLYSMFFASYTEKVWGIGCDELRAEWAAQRIRGLSFGSAARAALSGSGGQVRSLIGQFHYPRLGPGQLWTAMRERIEALGGTVRTCSPVTGIRLAGSRVVEVAQPGITSPVDNVISSLPLGDVVSMSKPAPPLDVREAARNLRYRDFLTVALVLDGSEPFPDNWIYIHDPEVSVARIQNYRAWSESMVPVEGKSCLGLEYFCFRGDAIWSMDDESLVELAKREVECLGLAAGGQVDRGYVVRVPKAYPIYDERYGERLDVVRRWLEGIENLQQVGRNGLHRYNNSDHSMLTAIRAVENLRGAHHDLWAVNADAWYHETEASDEQPYLRVPQHASEAA